MPLAHGLHGVGGQRMLLCLLAQPVAKCRIEAQCFDGLTQCDGVLHWHGEPSDAMRVDGVDAVVQLGADNGFATGHGFELHQTKGLVGRDRWQAEHIARLIAGHHVCRRQPTAEPNAVNNAKLLGLR